MEGYRSTVEFAVLNRMARKGFTETVTPKRWCEPCRYQMLEHFSQGAQQVQRPEVEHAWWV